MEDIVVQGLCKSFDGTAVLQNFSARFAAGRTTCLMGRSGCGKTTLLNILMGLLPADSGTVTGVPARLAAVFQEDRLLESFSAASNLAFVRPRASAALAEPFKGLDETTRRAVADYLRRYTDGATVILVTHDEDEVALMGGALIRMEAPSA